MILLLIAVAVFLIVKTLIVSFLELFLPKEMDDKPTFTVHNHITENHLHISKEDLKSFIDK